MPTPTYTPLANTTLSGSASSVTFSSIGQSYRDLVLVVGNLTASTISNSYLFMRFNGVTSTTYNSLVMGGSGSASYSNFWSNADSFQCLLNLETATPANSIYNIMDYSATDKHKSVLQRFNSPAKFTEAYAHRWASTAAITSVTVFLYSGTMNAGSTFALYGVNA